MQGATRERVSRDFELRGAILRFFEGQTKGGDDYVMLNVCGFTFFPDKVFWPVLGELEVGDQVIVKGESVGERMRNGQSVPQFELYEIQPVNAKPAGGVLKAAAANGNSASS